MLEAADVGGQAFYSLTLASLSSGTTLFFCLPIVIHPGGAFQELASQSLSLHGSAPTKQLIALLLWFLFRSLSINILKTLTRVNAERLKSASVLQD